MFAKTPKEVACAKALQSVDFYIHQAAADSAMSLDDRMKILQWAYKKIPEINKLLIAIKTESINKK